MLSKDADYPTTELLAEHLLDKLNNLIPEYNLLDDNDSFKDYMNGLINAYENVLFGIGYPLEKMPTYEDVMN